MASDVVGSCGVGARKVGGAASKIWLVRLHTRRGGSARRRHNFDATRSIRFEMLSSTCSRLRKVDSSDLRYRSLTTTRATPFGFVGRPRSLSWTIRDLVRAWRFPGLGGLIGRYVELANDEFWRLVLRRAVRMIISANTPDPLDVAIPTAVAVLELLGWAVESAGWAPSLGSGPRSSRLSASVGS